MAIWYINKGTLFEAFYHRAPYLTIVFWAHIFWDTRYIHTAFIFQIFYSTSPYYHTIIQGTLHRIVQQLFLNTQTKKACSALQGKMITRCVELYYNNFMIDRMISMAMTVRYCNFHHWLNSKRSHTITYGQGFKYKTKPSSLRVLSR